VHPSTRAPVHFNAYATLRLNGAPPSSCSLTSKVDRVDNLIQEFIKQPIGGSQINVING
jgi:hypothetical protein